MKEKFAPPRKNSMPPRVKGRKMAEKRKKEGEKDKKKKGERYAIFYQINIVILIIDA